jgi:exodeoxyribonuclease V alpha subunit
MERDRDHLLTVTVDDELFRGSDGRFCILRAHSDSVGPEPLVLVGDLRDTQVGETLRVRGHYERHPTHGRRFRVESFTPILPTSSTGIVRYLGSGLIDGVGPALAERLVARFGDKTLDVITTQSARLREVAGIGKQRAQAIAQAVQGRLADAELLSFLQSLGLGTALSQRIRQRYGIDTARVIREDPYLAAEQISGIGFRTADAMALALGFTRDDPRRAAGAVLHVIARAADGGHTFLPVSELSQHTAALDVPADRIEPALYELQARGLLQCDGASVYAPPLYAAEVGVAAQLRVLAARPVATPPARLRDAVAAATAGLDLAQAQREAVVATFERSLLVVTGGPGTGKTTTVRAIVRAQEFAERKLLLCAPTGRAAKRLADASQHEAHTIHRLLEWNPRAGGFARNRENPLEADVVLMDEASMLDLQLAHHLLVALPPRASLVLIGDVEQLPPVGPGPVLRELLESGACHVVRLTEVFRQAAASTIVRAAHEVQRGLEPRPSAAGSHGPGDLFVVRAEQPETVTTRLRELLVRMREAYGLDPIRDVQVLTPMRRGPLGTEALNLQLQQALNPASSESATPTFRVGDKVMQLRNDYDREVWNGDVGEIQRVDAGIVFVDLQGRQVSYEPEAQGALSLAYACTVHKVQGSEFPAVIIVLHRSHYMLLSRPLIYTALTRARRLAVILGDGASLKRAVRNAEQRTTHSRLRMRLLEPGAP